ASLREASLLRIHESEARVLAHRETIQTAEAEGQTQAAAELQQISELEATHQKAQEEAESRAILNQRLNDEIADMQAQGSEHQLEFLDSDGDVHEITAIEPFVGTPQSHTNQVKEIEPIDGSWLQIDLEHTGNGSEAKTNGSANLVKTIEPLIPKPIETHHFAGLASVFEPEENDSVSSLIMERLNSDASSQRAAALADLTDLGGEEAFHLIAKSFDDPVVEV